MLLPQSEAKISSSFHNNILGNIYNCKCILQIFTLPFHPLFSRSGYFYSLVKIPIIF